MLLLSLQDFTSSFLQRYMSCACCTTNTHVVCLTAEMTVLTFSVLSVELEQCHNNNDAVLRKDKKTIHIAGKVFKGGDRCLNDYEIER